MAHYLIGLLVNHRHVFVMNVMKSLVLFKNIRKIGDAPKIFEKL